MAPVSVDGEALRCLAGLLIEKHVGIIIAADPHGVLLKELQALLAKASPAVQLEPTDGSSCRPEAFRPLARINQARHLVNSSDLLIKGLRLGYKDLSREHIAENQRALADLIVEFPNIYIWGWSERNIVINLIVPANHNGRFYIFGEPASENIVEHYMGNYTIVRDAGGAPGAGGGALRMASTGFLKQLGQSLFPRPQTAAPPGGLAGQPPAPENPPPPTPMFRPASLLWPDDTLTDLLALPNKLCINGVQGHTVRFRFADRLRLELERNGRSCFFTPGAQIQNLMQSIRPFLNANGVDAIIACLGSGGGPPSAEWPDVVEDLKRRVAGSGPRVFLFTPAEWLSHLPNKR